MSESGLPMKCAVCLTVSGVPRRRRNAAGTA
jgi:hypothetical protein